MVPDIRLWLQNTHAVYWEVAPGVRQSVHHDTQQYMAGAWLPLAFKAPAPEEREFMTSRSKPQDKNFVAILPTSSEAVEQLRSYYHSWKKAEAQEALALEAIEGIVRSTASVLRWPEQVRCLGMVEDAPGQVSVTRITSGKYSGQLLGLHIDSWSAAVSGGRSKAPNRFCLNLGPGSRWLLYLPFSQNALLANGRWKEAPKEPSPYRFKAEDLSVIRVLIPPGFAYVAPTENMIHDGSTVNAVGPSCKLSFLGHFLPA